MKARGTVKSIGQDWQTKKISVTFELSEINTTELAGIEGKDLDLEIKQHREHRSGQANRLLWACLGEAAAHLHTDKWTLYLNALRLYGQFTLIDMEPQAFEKFRTIYRECEDIGSHTVNGKEMRQVLCYYGSSTYNSEEFSRLLNGVIDDMKQAGLETPTSEEMRRALEELEKNEKT